MHRLGHHLVPIALLFSISCQTAEDEFIGSRLLDMCDDAYMICGVPSGCVLDEDHYVEGAFPGTQRVVVQAEDRDMELSIRIFFSSMKASGTELLVQIYEPDCTVDTTVSRAHLQDLDIFDEAGDNRTLTFELTTQKDGEHLLELYSDATTEYLLIAEPL